MTTLEAIILGIIQGLTEFLPVSSSGHLTLFQHIFGFTNLEDYIIFDLVCHLGTLVAIFFVYASQIKKVLFHDRIRLFQIVIGTLPLFPLLLLLKPIESLFDQVNYLGYFFIGTAGLLYLGILFGKEKPVNALRKKWWIDALIIGIFQAFALIPGISRSGSTISGARLLGWERQDAVTFSFLLAIPAILGGTALKTFQLIQMPTHNSQPLALSEYLAGFTTSFLVGYAALLFLIRVAAKDKFMYFVWYCLVLGLGTTIYFNLNS